MKKTFWFLFALISLSSYAQRTKLIDSHVIIEEGIKLHDEENYTLALDKYNIVDRNDTNFMWALVEKAVTLNALKKYDEAINKCLYAITLQSEFKPNLFNLLGSAYDDSGQPEKAIEAYKAGLKYSPYFYLLNYNIALTYNRLEKYDSAIAYAKKAIDCNIYHPSSYYLLGEIYHNRKLYTQAIISLQMFLLLEQGTSRTGTAIEMLNSTCEINEIKKPINIPISSEDKIFESLNTILKSKVAINDKYKTPVKIFNDPIIKQMYVLLEKIETSDDIGNFWHRNFTRFLKGIYKEGYYLPHVYCMFNGLKIKKLQADIKKKKTTIENYKKWAIGEINKSRGKRYVYRNKEWQAVNAWYNNNNLISLGNVNDVNLKNPLYLGFWEFFYNSGVKSAEGNFNSDGKNDGIWYYYYPSGTLKDKRVFENGEVYEIQRYYEYNGALKMHSKRTNGVNDYVIQFFDASGTITGEENYVEDKLNGTSTYYYSNGKKKSEFLFKNDAAINSTKYYSSGKIKSKSEKKENEITELTEYYENNNISLKGQLKNEKAFGVCKWYFKNGNIKEITSFNLDGEIQDSSFEYHENGKISSISLYDKGKKNGTEKNYDDDGILYSEVLYKNDDILSYKCFDKNGKIINSGSTSNNVLNFTSHYPTGEKHIVGFIKNGSKDGCWKYYNRFGVLTKEENYLKGELEGITKIYFDDGKLKYEYSYAKGKEDGYYFKYYHNGQIEKEGWLKDGETEGYWYNYWSHGKLESVNYYLNDELYGYQQDYRIDGTLSSESFIIDDLDQQYIYFDTNNVAIDTLNIIYGDCKTSRLDPITNQKIEYELINGLIVGTLKKYDVNNNLVELCEYELGKMNGKINKFDSDGLLLLEGEYVDGKKSGTWKWYHKSKLTCNGQYLDGEQIGTWTYFNNDKPEEIEIYNEKGEIIQVSVFAESGELLLIKKYKNDFIYSYTYLNKDNSYVPDIILTNGTGKIQAFFPNGKLSYEQTYNKGYTEGNLKKYYPNGNIYQSIPYNNIGWRDGIKFTYWSNGKVKSEEPYSDGDQNGISKFYRNDGSIEYTESYYYDYKHGLFTYYDLNGNTTRVQKYSYDSLFK